MNEEKKNGYIGAPEIRVLMADNGFMIRLPNTEFDAKKIRVFGNFTDLVNDIAEIFEVADGENIAKGD